MTKKIRIRTALALFLLSVLVTAGCPAADSGNSNSTPAAEMTEFERELKNLKTADFNFIYVFSRKDGSKMDSEDVGFIRERTYKMNRRTRSEDGTMVFIGSNFAFEDEELAALRERFEVQDFSKPASEIEKQEREKGEPANANDGDPNRNG